MPEGSAAPDTAQTRDALVAGNTRAYPRAYTKPCRNPGGLRWVSAAGAREALNVRKKKARTFAHPPERDRDPGFLLVRCGSCIGSPNEACAVRFEGFLRPGNTLKRPRITANWGLPDAFMGRAVYNGR